MGRRTAREQGLELGTLEVGPRNAITDVEGVKVGHTTIVEGEGKLKPGKGPVRTGVTAVVPVEEGWPQVKVEAGLGVLNGCGELTGALVLEEFGFLETPILLTNTNSVGACGAAMVSYLADRGLVDPHGDGPVIPVVAECDDSFLNDIWGLHVGREHVYHALDSATADFAQGGVGGGTGMSCLGFKGGIGSSSRVAKVAGEGYALGVLVQANFGLQEQLTLRGVSVGHLLTSRGIVGAAEGRGSIIMVVATEAPLSSRQLKRMARRTSLGLARLGSVSTNGSGDITLAFTSAHRPDPTRRASKGPQQELEDGALTPLFHATVEATEEAVVNALFAAETMVGRDGNTSFALPVDDVLSFLR